LIYRFGHYALDDSGRELRRDGVPVDTEPKAFELLLYLLRHRDCAVSKDELQTALWPRSIVSETALTRCVMKARRAVGDDAGRQTVIRTLHSHGYRFIANLEPQQEPPRHADETAAARPGVAPTRYVLAGIAALLVALAVGYFALRGTPLPAEEGALAVLPVEDLTDDDNLAWVRLGLMSLLNRMLEDGGVALVPERSVLSAIADAKLGSPIDSALLARIRLRAGAGAVLNTTLDVRGGLYRLAAVMTHGDGHRTRRVIVGDKPAAIAADMAGITSGLL
jgi:DNA-binding winged helix-turn-helix (wHTH) protein